VRKWGKDFLDEGSSSCLCRKEGGGCAARGDGSRLEKKMGFSFCWFEGWGESKTFSGEGLIPLHLQHGNQTGRRVLSHQGPTPLTSISWGATGSVKGFFLGGHKGISLDKRGTIHGGKSIEYVGGVHSKGSIVLEPKGRSKWSFFRGREVK